MSTVVPILSNDETHKILEWVRQQCSSPTFDPSSPDFQAAIALIAAHDQYRQYRNLNLANPKNIALVAGNNPSFKDVTSLAQILIYRSMIRKIPISPYLQRTAMPSLDPNIFNTVENEITDEFDTSSANIAMTAFSHLTPHSNDFITDTSEDVLRNCFVCGAGQNPYFLTDRRKAVLKASQNNIKTKQYKDIINHEITKLGLARSQQELRQKFCRFALDPVEFSMPDCSDYTNPHQTQNFGLSPQHIGIVCAYENTANIENNSMSLRLRQVIMQANKFFNALAATTQRQRAIKSDLEQRKKDIEKERNRAKRTQEKVRWDLLKQKDMVKYRETIKQMKDQRIQLILDQTDHYMKELSDKIRKTHAAIHNDEKNSDNIYDFDLKLPEDITQPEHLTGTLKEYQVKGLQWLASLYQSHLNGILADEMGLGKTVQTIALLAWLFEKNDAGPHLIIAPLSTLSNWESEFSRWFPQFKIIKYVGNRPERKELEHRYITRGSSINAVLTSYQIVVLDKAVLSKLDYSYIVIDEAHKLKNHEGKLSQTLTHHYTAKNRLLLTGTPLQNNPRELWSLLNFILPNIFNDHNKFDDWFTAPFAKAGEGAQLTAEEQWLVINQLHAVLRPFIFRRLKSDVANQLPDKKEETLLCAMSAWQHSMYLTMEESSVMVMPDLTYKRMDNKTMQCRKICNHPYLFLDTYYVNSMLIRSCGKFELLDRILPKFKATGHRVLIFSQMTELLDLLEDLLKLLDFTFLRLDGSTKEETRRQYMDEFNAQDSPYFVFLLSTRAGGLGLNLQTADTVIIYDADWNPFADMQASSRVHRIGQEKEVLILNLSTNDTVERKVMKVQNQKRTFEDMIIGAAIFNDESNIDDRKAVYQAVTAKNQSGGVSDVMTDEQINKIIARTPEEREKFEEMDIERDERYQREWERAGHNTDYPRLMTYDELPEYLKVPASELIKDEELPEIRRSRSRNTLSLLDNITETEYTRLIEEGKDPTEHLDEITTLRGQCMKYIKKAQEILGDRFDELPTPQQLPEYYDIIKTPITFNQIKTRSKNGEYDSVEDLLRDLTLMANNALRFNAQDTILYKNAEDLLELCNDGKSDFLSLPQDASAFDDL
ncbi:Chromatin structure-remodeling complex subunit snf21 [Tritrichomonas foetus]|uniref:Chromatin structure-remodeling complex subunit snf21 n=1 Tax=Tritrichomonas foetus TaxID=1144522 RepID=A0A1J4KKR9_9EUKA|nr:Chromatin structure-remodeling complex subunit snf21 [Tritrichomonas foetus]|eukprot:OHT10396.1 Chromatin structure-remodeling complex subunit snf21 [Tritrichomonas foetus]